jgi:hypothetical protein
MRYLVAARVRPEMRRIASEPVGADSALQGRRPRWRGWRGKVTPREAERNVE